jgi:hypothetical protein
MRYITNVALHIRGDRFEKGSEIELSAEEAKAFDPADVTAIDAIPGPEPEPVLADIPLEEMTLADLKARAKELGLSASGSKADIEERIRLQLDGSDGTEEEELPEDNQ